MMPHVCVLAMPDKADPDNCCDPDPGYVNGYPWNKPRCGICGRFMRWPALEDEEGHEEPSEAYSAGGIRA